MVKIPPELVHLLRHHLQAYGCARTGGCPGVPAAGRSARVSTAASGTRRSPRDRQPGPLRPYDLRHAALSLWLASRASPAEIAARAGHSVHVLLTTYAHVLPGYGQIANGLIDRALHASTGPPMTHKPGITRPEICPPCVRVTAGPDGTEPDLLSSRRIQHDALDLRKH